MNTMLEKDLPDIFIARHGQTRFNEQHRLQGRLDIPLNARGREQVSANLPQVAELSISRILTSPLKRAYQTAEIYADYLDVPLLLEPRLSEIHHGRWEGKSFAALMQLEGGAYSRWLEDPASVPIPGGSETIWEARNRVLSAVTDMIFAYQSEVLLLVMHKHIRAVLRCALQDLPFSQFREQITEEIGPSPIPAKQLRRLRSVNQL